MTDYLAAVTVRTHPYAAAVEPLTNMLQSNGARRVRDLCSGAGGPWPVLLPTLSASLPGLSLELSDAYPNTSALDHFPPGSPVTYRGTALRATDTLPRDGSAITLFSSLHHFRPADATQILRNAEDAQSPIAIFEATHRSPLALVAMCVVPIVVLLVTPQIRPLRWWRLLLTYIVPVLPVAIWWDGLVSCLRTYTRDELLAMTSSLHAGDMAWTCEEVRRAGQPLPMTMLIGVPVSRITKATPTT